MAHDAALSGGLLVLAVESATASLSLALLRGEAVVAETHAEAGSHHAETLLPSIVDLLERAGVLESDVAAFAVSIGPGSFTSLRVGLATVKGLAFGTGRPVAAVPTLAALAWESLSAEVEGPKEARLALLDARRGEAYAAAYASTPGPADLHCLLAEGVHTPEALAPLVPRPCLCVGDGAPIFGPRLQALVGEEVQIGSGSPRALARAVGVLGARMLARGEGQEARDVALRYVRRAEAEALRVGKATEEGGPAPSR